MSRREIREAVKEAAAGNALDRAIAWVAPQIAARRQNARMFMALSGGYTGAAHGRRQTSEWKPTKGQSADADILLDLPTLRDRSSDLVRNEPIAAGAIAGAVTSVVGTGLAVQPRVDAEALGMTEEEADAWQKSTKREWKLWFESTACDASRTLTGYGLQALVFRSALERGDCFTFTPMRKLPGMPYQTCLQVIEADQVSNENYKIDTNECAGGVALDALRAPTGYWLRRSHPGALNKIEFKWDLIPAFGAKTGRRQVLHVYDKLRPGQTRGVPYLAPVIETLKMLGRYTEAEMMGAVISGMFTAFVTSDRGGLDINDPTGLGAEVGATGSDKDIKLAPGAILDLNPGEKVEFANPSRPNQAFTGFVDALADYIGVALELPKEVLMKHFTASYSASRAALLEAWKWYRRRRAWLVDTWCNPVYETWMDEAVAIGRIHAPGYFEDPVLRRAYLGCEWVGDGPISVDPVKDIEAAMARVELGISNIDKEAMAWDGGNFEDNHAQRVREHKARVSAGLDSETVTPPPAGKGILTSQPDGPQDQGGSDKQKPDQA